MDQVGGASSCADRVFMQALREFKDNLVATYSVAVNQNQTEKLNIKYKDLIVNFLQVRLASVFSMFSLASFQVRLALSSQVREIQDG